MSIEMVRKEHPRLWCSAVGICFRRLLHFQTMCSSMFVMLNSDLHSIYKLNLPSIRFACPFNIHVIQIARFDYRFCLGLVLAVFEDGLYLKGWILQCYIYGAWLCICSLFPFCNLWHKYRMHWKSNVCNLAAASLSSWVKITFVELNSI